MNYATSPHRFGTGPLGPEYNFGRVLAALIDAPDPKPGDPPPDVYELEVSRGVARAAGIEPHPRAIYLPLHAAQRDLTTQTGGGSTLIASTNPGGRFIQSLQQSSVLMAAGAQLLTLERSNAAVPVATNAPQVAWLAGESAQVGDAEQTFGMRTSSPLYLAGSVTCSRQLLLQGSTAIEALIFGELGRAIAAEKDRAALQGTGADGQPLGLLGIDGVPSASGASLTWANVAADLRAVLDAKVSGPVSFIGTPTVGEVLMVREKVTDSGCFVLADERVAGRPFFSTTGAPSGTLIVGDFSQLQIVIWGPLMIAVDVYTGWRAGKVTLRAIMAVDFVYAHPSSFRVRTSVS